MAALTLSPDRLVPTPALAEQTRVPQNYLAKVLQQLAAGDLITGRRGVGGGYRLKRPAREIRLIDVVNVVSPARRTTGCPAELLEADGRMCALHRKTEEAVAAVAAVFSGVTLHDLATDAVAGRPLCTADQVPVGAGPAEGR